MILHSALQSNDAITMLIIAPHSTHNPYQPPAHSLVISLPLSPPVIILPVVPPLPLSLSVVETCHRSPHLSLSPPHHLINLMYIAISLLSRLSSAVVVIIISPPCRCHLSLHEPLALPRRHGTSA